MTTASVHLGPPARPPPRVPEAQAPTPGRGHLPLAVLHSLSRLQASEWGRSFSGCLEGLGGTKLLLSPPQHPLTSSKAHLPPRLFQACCTHCLPGQGPPACADPTALGASRPQPPGGVRVLPTQLGAMGSSTARGQAPAWRLLVGSVSPALSCVAGRFSVVLPLSLIFVNLSI